MSNSEYWTPKQLAERWQLATPTLDHWRSE